MNFEHVIEVRKTYWPWNKRLFDLVAALKEVHFRSSLTFINRNTRMSRRLLLVLLFIAVVALDQADGGCYPVHCIVLGWSPWSRCIVYGCNGEGSQKRHRAIKRNPECGGKKCPVTCEARRCPHRPYGKREMIEANIALQQNGKNDEHMPCLIHTQSFYILRTGFLHLIQPFLLILSSILLPF